ncbi:MAG TPA: hypothetical protein VNX25_10260 [Verrucomicrobiae bacterium]|nr:hypothetical protein [Verrucomicrobiae bacterium]
MRNSPRAGPASSPPPAPPEPELPPAGPLQDLRHIYPRGAGPTPMICPIMGVRASGRPQTRSTMKRRVLFLCTHNSCRSQIAEGPVNHFLGDSFGALSAGTEKTSVNRKGRHERDRDRHPRPQVEDDGRIRR